MSTGQMDDQDRDKMLCPICETEVAEFDNFCLNCGVKFEEDAPDAKIYSEKKGNQTGQQILITIISLIILTTIVIISFLANLNFLTAVEYTTHSAIQEYVSFNPSHDLLMFTIACVVLWIFASILLQLLTRGLAATPIRLLLILLFFVPLYYSVVGTMDVTASDKYVWWMKNIALVTDCGIITITLISIFKHRLSTR